MINILGYGLYPDRHLSLESLQCLRTCSDVLVLPQGRRIRDFLETNAIAFRDLSHLYTLGGARALVYRRIATHVIDQARSGRDISYLTYGHPFILERPSELIRKRAARVGIPVRVFPALSFMDVFLAEFGIPITASGCTVLLATRMVSEKIRIDPRTPLFLAQIGAFNHADALPLQVRESDEFRPLVDYLKGFYSSKHRVHVFDSAASGDNLIQARTSLGKLADFAPHLSYSTSIYIPPIGR